MTSTTLIPVFIGTLQDQSVQLCNARDLHAFLQVGKDFSNWIKDRLEAYGFIEGEDYSPNLANRSGGTAGKRRTDYHLTLDTAKELAMVENNEQGRMARRYFIALEKELTRLGQAQPLAEQSVLPNPHHITPAQAGVIATLMCTCFPDSVDRHSAWKRFNANFKIHAYRKLPASKFDEALTFIESTDARRRNEFGREGRQGLSLASHNVGPQIDLAALSRKVAEYLMIGQRSETLSIDQKTLVEIEALLSETMAKFNFLPNASIFQNLHSVLRLIRNGDSKGNRRTEARYLEATQSKLTAQSDLVQLMRESTLVCVEIGLHEIEAAAGHDAEQIHAGKLAEVTAKALRKRPEHLADIQLVSGWMFAEAHCTEAQRDVVRKHWLSVAQIIEDALS